MIFNIVSIYLFNISSPNNKFKMVNNLAVIATVCYVGLKITSTVSDYVDSTWSANSYAHFSAFPPHLLTFFTAAFFAGHAAYMGYSYFYPNYD